MKGKLNKLGVLQALGKLFKRDGPAPRSDSAK